MNCYLLGLHHKIHNTKKNTPSYGAYRWCTTPLQSFIFCSCWVSGFVCVYPFISSWGSLASGNSVFTKFLGKTKNLLFKALGDVEFLGRNTLLPLPSAWREWNEMNEWFEGPHRIWASRTLNNNKQQQQEACCFSIFLPWNKEDICSALLLESWERDTTKQCSSLHHHHHHVVHFIWSQVLKNALSTVNVLGEVLIQVCFP